jgi:hypothetical protein
MYAPTVNAWIKLGCTTANATDGGGVIAIAPQANSNVSSAAEEFEKLPIVAALLSSTGPLAVVGVSLRRADERTATRTRI